MYLNVVARGIDGTKDEGKNVNFLVDLHNRIVRADELPFDSGKIPETFQLFGKLNLQKGGYVHFPIARGEQPYGMIIESMHKMEATQVKAKAEVTTFECHTANSTYYLQLDPNGIFASGGVFARDSVSFPNEYAILSEMPILEEGKPLSLKCIDGKTVNTSDVLFIEANKKEVILDTEKMEEVPNPATAVAVDSYKEERD